MDKLEKAKLHIFKVQREKRRQQNRLLETAAVGTSAFFLARVEGKDPDLAFFGVSPSVAVGVALTIWGEVQHGGTRPDQTGAIVSGAGKGALCAWASKMGRQAGQDAAD